MTGLGYVGLPLACMFAARHEVTGFDTDGRRVAELSSGHDRTGEVGTDRLHGSLSGSLRFTTDPGLLGECSVHIITVPTPVDCHHRPDLTALVSASGTIGRILKPGDTVVYESTVYPGVTEEVCVPELEKASGLRLNRDFHVGYSPERVNPGDRRHTVENIIKLTSGSTPAATEFIDSLYRSVLSCPTYKTPSIRVAEAAKILENVQRDVNVALMNEAAIVMEALGVDFTEVLKAAATKWNFLPFEPGLVGGHCISVDPHYLIERAEMDGIRPRVMSEARRVNDSMPAYVTDKILEAMNLRGIRARDSRILLLGFAFKENCPDIRNTLVADIWRRLRKYTADITVLDPYIDAGEALHRYGIAVSGSLPGGSGYDAIVGCVAHDCFAGLDLEPLRNKDCVVYDIKGRLDSRFVTHRLGRGVTL